jgi:hypothetical protein
MYSVGSGMVLAIGDRAGATFVTLLAATATQFARAGRLWTLWTIEIEVAVRLGWSESLTSGAAAGSGQIVWAGIPPSRSRHGHYGDHHCPAIALAEPICRAIDRFDPP